MSATAEAQSPQQPTHKKKKRKGILIGLTVLFLLIGIAWLVYWFLVLRHYQETDDAYVAGNQVQVMAQVSGSVNKVWFDDTDFVKKGMCWFRWIKPMLNRRLKKPRRRWLPACDKRIS